MLNLKNQHAWSFELQRTSEGCFKRYAKKNVGNIAEKYDLDVDAIVFVTGTTMTGDWNAMYSERKDKDVRVGLTAGIQEVAVFKTGLSYQTSNGRISHDNSGHHHSSRHNASASECCSNPENQCIFMKSFSFKRNSRFKEWLSSLVQTRTVDVDNDKQLAGSPERCFSQRASDFRESDSDQRTQKGDDLGTGSGESMRLVSSESSSSLQLCETDADSNHQVCGNPACP